MAKTVKVAMIGSGGMANAHLPGLKAMADVQVVGFCDTVLERAQGLGLVLAQAQMKQMSRQINQLLGQVKSLQAQVQKLQAPAGN